MPKSRMLELGPMDEEPSDLGGVFEEDEEEEEEPEEDPARAALDAIRKQLDVLTELLAPSPEQPSRGTVPPE